jgi:hypothetical protein
MTEPDRKDMTGSMARALVYCIALSLPFLFFVGLESLRPQTPPGDSSANWTQDAESRMYKTVTRLATFSAVAAFGALGAAVSVVSRKRELRGIPAIEGADMWVIQTIGAVFAILLAIMFLGGLIGGSLFPSSNGNWFSVVYIHPEFAKLLVWSFIAGFSERFVPQILENLVDRFRKEEAAGRAHQSSPIAPDEHHGE